MAPTFDEFKSYFEFSIEVCGIVGSVLAVVYKLGYMKAFWRVARGRANSLDHSVALEALQEGGAIANQLVRELARTIGQRGFQEEAGRLQELGEEASSYGGARNEPQNEARLTSPEQMA